MCPGEGQTCSRPPGALYARWWGQARLPSPSPALWTESLLLDSRGGTVGSAPGFTWHGTIWRVRGGGRTTEQSPQVSASMPQRKCQGLAALARLSPSFLFCPLRLARPDILVWLCPRRFQGDHRSIIAHVGRLLDLSTTTYFPLTSLSTKVIRFSIFFMCWHPYNSCSFS